MQVENIKINDVIPYENNPRKNDASVESVAESIKQFGFKVPIVVDKDNVVIAGHTRLKAAKRLKLKEVPCIRADDLTDEQVKAFRLADNKVGEASEWDFTLLEEELKDILNIDMSALGFDFDTDILDSIDDGYMPEPPAEPKSKRGEIWVLGAHRVMCGDATDPEDVKNLLGGVQLTCI